MLEIKESVYNEMLNKLKPCPKCGRKPLIDEGDDFYIIKCESASGELHLYLSLASKLGERDIYSDIAIWNDFVKENSRNFLCRFVRKFFGKFL